MQGARQGLIDSDGRVYTCSQLEYPSQLYPLVQIRSPELHIKTKIATS